MLLVFVKNLKVDVGCKVIGWKGKDCDKYWLFLVICMIDRNYLLCIEESK